MNNHSITFDNNEILALIRLIFFIKFETDNLELLTYAGSPLINSAFKKFLSSHPYYEDRLNDFDKVDSQILEFIKSKIIKDNGGHIDDNILKELLENCVFPYEL